MSRLPNQMPTMPKVVNKREAEEIAFWEFVDAKNELMKKYNLKEIPAEIDTVAKLGELVGELEAKFKAEKEAAELAKIEEERLENEADIKGTYRR
jgi:hypothetical protein